MNDAEEVSRDGRRLDKYITYKERIQTRSNQVSMRSPKDPRPTPKPHGKRSKYEVLPGTFPIQVKEELSTKYFSEDQ